MALPSAGYDTSIYQAPSGDITDFTLMINSDNFSANYKSDVNSADGARARFAKDSGAVEAPFDFIDFVDSPVSGWARVYIGNSFAADSAATRTIRAYSPNTRNTAYSPSDTYGSDNAYDSNWKAYYPFGGGSDRTVNGYDLTGVGSPTVGGGSLKGLASTDYDGSTQYSYNAAIDFEGEAELTLLTWVDFDVSTATNTVMGQWGNTVAEQTALLTVQSSNVVLAGIRATANGFPTSTGTVADNTEAFIGVTHTSGSQLVYIDGSNDGSSSATGVLSASSGQRFELATADGGSDNFNGELNNTSIHTATRSGDWISEEYDQTNDNATFWGTWAWTAPGGTTHQLSGSINSASQLTGKLNLTQRISGSLNTSSNTTGVLRLIQRLKGSLNSSNIVSGTIRLIQRISGLLNSKSHLSGNLRVPTTHNLSGSIESHSQLSGTLVDTTVAEGLVRIIGVAKSLTISGVAKSLKINGVNKSLKIRGSSDG